MSEDTAATFSTLTGKNTKKTKKKYNKNKPQQTDKTNQKCKPDSSNPIVLPSVVETKPSQRKSIRKSPTAENKDIKNKHDKSVKFQNISDIEEKLKFPKTPVPKDTAVALEKLDLQMVEESQRQLRKRKSQTETQVTQNPKVTKKELKDKSKLEKKVNNTSIHGKIVPEMVQDMSTPNEILRTKALRKSGNNSCFGFEAVKRTSLPVSPVCKLPITPLSDYASMDTFSHDVTMEDSSQKSKSTSPSLFSMDEDGKFEIY